MSEVQNKPVEEPTDQQELTATAQNAIVQALAGARVLNQDEIAALMFVISNDRSEPKKNK